ncbi:MAG: glycine betaine ABC transporter substrate-binding protein [Firmicutes bacterium]|nr:glycine betaine ABC transporter substrate-binding protein [Bacillota bacterium]
MRKLLKTLSIALILVFTAGILFGCGGQEGTGENGNGEDQGGNQTESKGKVSIGYVEWDDCIASTYVLKNVLANEGYDVEITSVDAGVMWSGVAQGDFDFMVAAWLPGTHKNYWADFKDQVVDLGPNFEGAKIGLVVPEYVNIDSIAEMNSAADKFDGAITGIEPGAGIMQATEEAITEYGLNLELNDSSSAAMAAALERAINNEEWIAVTGWNPHWKFAKFDLKYLEDPKGVYGGEEHIDTVTRQGFEEDMPEAASIADNFYWTSEELGPVMVNIKEGMTPDEAAQKFIEGHQDLVNEWTS